MSSPAADRLRFLAYASVGALPWIAGPILLVGALWMPDPTVEQRLTDLGFAHLLDEVDEEDDGDERVVDLPALFSQLPRPEPEGEPTPPSDTPELPPVRIPSATRAAAGPAPELAVALAEGAPARAVGGAGAGEGAKATGAGHGRSGARSAKSRKPRSCDNPNPNIRVGSDGLLEIDRSLVDHYTANLESFMKLGYSRPYDEDEVHGWYISGFGCTSPVAKAGFKRGDVVLSVNGKKTRTWVGVYLLYQKLKHKDDFVVEVVRKGEPVTLRFRVVPG